MIKMCSTVLCIVIILSFFLPTAAMAIDVPSQSAILIEEKTGRILYNKNSETEMAMASTTKIMTAILALEYGNLDDVVVVGEEAANVEGSSIYIEKGDKITLEDLVYGLMLRSGNDAAYAIATHISGSLKNFVELMNEKAQIIGATNTNFTNPHGLYEKEHYTTAKDLALITQYAFRNEDFKKIMSAKKTDIKINNQVHTLYNKNKLLTGYDGGNGVKTGYTIDAGKCLVFSAEREGMQMIGVILRASDIWAESRILLDYGFEQYTTKNVMKKGEYITSIYVEDGINDQFKIISDENIDIPIKQGENIERVLHVNNIMAAPIYNKQRIGSVDFLIDGEIIYSKDLYSPQKVYEKDYLKFLKENLRDYFNILSQEIPIEALDIKWLDAS